MAEPKRISTGYEPRKIQAELHQKLKRFNVLVMHRRFGKTVFCINEMIDRGLTFNKKDPLTGKPLLNPRFAYLAPLYGQAKRVAWDYLKLYTAAIPGATPNEADLRVDIPRPHLGDSIRISLLGADNPMALKGIYLDGAVLDEYGEMNPVAWSEVIRPTLSDRLGWVIFAGTPKGKNQFYDLREYAKKTDSPDWFTATYKASETKIIHESELSSAKATMTDEAYNQEFECDFNSALIGAYFAKEISVAEKEGRITRIPHDPMLPVDTYWDLGINDTTAIWFVQSFRGRHRFIDYHEVCGLGIPEIVANLKGRGYNYGNWIFPHDVEVRDFSTGKARLQVFNNLGCRPNRVVPRIGNKMDSINAARMIFGACEFDAQKCDLGLKALSSYQRKWNVKNNVFEESPLHNFASNGADAFQQFALGSREDSRTIESNYHGSKTYESETDYSVYA